MMRNGMRALVAALVLAAMAPVGGGASPAGALSYAPQPYAWVERAYGDALGRPPTGPQAQHRARQLAAGVPRRSIADELVGSAEHAARVVDRQYRRVLGRPVDGPGQSYWVGRLQAGERVSTVTSFLYGSPEVFARSGGTAEGYVAFLYRDVLGREPDAAGATYWAGRIAAGGSRTRLARDWILSQEATELRAGVLFLELLDRPPSAAERVDWGARLRRSDERQVVAALLASSTAYALAEVHPRVTRLTAGNGHSRHASVSADGRIVAFASTASDLTPGGSPPAEDVFVIDRLTGRLRAITAGNGASNRPEVSADGSTVVFTSSASNLVAGDTNLQQDVFLAPSAGGAVTPVTVGSNRGGDSATVNGDGTVVAFSSISTNLLAGEPDDDVADVYVRTARPGQTPTVERVAGEWFGTRPQVSADGSAVVFEADVIGADPVRIQAMVVPLPLGPDPVATPLTEGRSFAPTVSADGSRISYSTLDPSVPGAMPMGEVAVVGAQGVTSRTHLPFIRGARTTRISGDGTTVLGTSTGHPSGTRDERLRVGDGENVFGVVDLPPSSDLTADGRQVVGSRGGQIVVFPF